MGCSLSVIEYPITIKVPITILVWHQEVTSRDLRGMPRVSKITFLVLYEAPYPSMVGAEGPEIFEFNTSALLEKSLKASHSSRLLFFLLFIFFECQGLGGDTIPVVSKSCWIRQCQPQNFCHFSIHKIADIIDGTTAKGGLELFKVKMPNTVGLISDVALVRPLSSNCLT